MVTVNLLIASIVAAATELQDPVTSYVGALCDLQSVDNAIWDIVERMNEAKIRRARTDTNKPENSLDNASS